MIVPTYHLEAPETIVVPILPRLLRCQCTLIDTYPNTCTDGPFHQLGKEYRKSEVFQLLVELADERKHP